MNKELLKALTGVIAPSGMEKAAASLIEETVTPYADEVAYDKIGNLICRISPKKGSAEKKIMLVAHMDEVGFIIKNIDNDGRLRIAPLGDIDTRTLSGRRVTLVNGVNGIIAAKPIHEVTKAERTVPTAMKSLFIELGVKDQAAVEALGVKLGDEGTYEARFTPLANGYIAGKAIGGRSAVMLLCELMKSIKEQKLDETMTNELCFVFSVKREITSWQFGADCAAFNLMPDMAVVLDATPAADFDGVKGASVFTKCGGGAVVAPADMRTIYDRKLFAETVAFCEENGVKLQHPMTAAGMGTEAGNIHKTGMGIPTISVHIPTRNYRSGAEIINENDLDAAGKILAHLVK